MSDKNTSYSGAGDKIYALFVLDIAHSRGALWRVWRILLLFSVA